MAIVCYYRGRLCPFNIRMETVEFIELVTILEGYSALVRVYRGRVRERVSDFKSIDGTRRGDSYRGAVTGIRVGNGDENRAQSLAGGRKSF